MGQKHKDVRLMDVRIEDNKEDCVLLMVPNQKDVVLMNAKIKPEEVVHVFVMVRQISDVQWMSAKIKLDGMEYARVTVQRPFVVPMTVVIMKPNEVVSVYNMVVWY